MTIGCFKDDPLVSFVVPVFGSGDFLDETLASIFNQSYDRLEVLLVQDGMLKQPAKSVITKWRQVDRRMRVVRHAHTGASGALKHGHELARGKILTWLDADDLLDPNYLEVLLPWFEPFIEILYSDYRIIDAEGVVTDPYHSAGTHPWGDISIANIRLGYYSLGVCKIYTASVYKASGGFHPKMHVAYGLYFNIMLARVGLEHGSRHCPQVLGSQRGHAGSMTNQILAGDLEDEVRSAKEILEKEGVNIPRGWDRPCDNADVQSEADCSAVPAGAIAAN